MDDICLIFKSRDVLNSCYYILRIRYMTDRIGRARQKTVSQKRNVMKVFSVKYDTSLQHK